jgi:hypothetical protein
VGLELPTYHCRRSTIENRFKFLGSKPPCECGTPKASTTETPKPLHAVPRIRKETSTILAKTNQSTPVAILPGAFAAYCYSTLPVHSAGVRQRRAKLSAGGRIGRDAAAGAYSEQGRVAGVGERFWLCRLRAPGWERILLGWRRCCVVAGVDGQAVDIWNRAGRLRR